MLAPHNCTGDAVNALVTYFTHGYEYGALRECLRNQQDHDFPNLAIKHAMWRIALQQDLIDRLKRNSELLSHSERYISRTGGPTLQILRTRVKLVRELGYLERMLRKCLYNEESQDLNRLYLLPLEELVRLD